MKGSLAVGAALAATVSATLPPGVVQWDIARRQPHPRALRPRSSADTDSTTIDNDVSQGGYFAECQIGTPSQSLTMQLDTGSSDTWAPSSNSSACRSTLGSSGCSLGSFNSDDSSSFAVVGQDEFSIAYVDGSAATGDYFTDTFTIGNSTVSNLTMGLAEQTDINYGLVGLGYKSNEAIVSTENSLSASYANLPVAMSDAGIINSVAYSLWLNDLDASTGQLLFGGIDTGKYTGDLTSINIYTDSSSNAYTSFTVALTSLNATSSTGTDVLTSREFPIAAVLDSGTTLTYLPNDLAEQIWTEAGAVYSGDIGAAVIPCSAATSSGVLQFGFAGPGGPVINITMDELVLELGGGAVFTTGEYKGQVACEFGIQNLSSDPFLLGDTFLRSAYVVYDLVNNKIGIAPTDFNSTETNIVAFESYGAAIPSATSAPNQQDVAASSYTTPAFSASSGFGSSDSSSDAAALAPFATGALPVALVTMAMFTAGGLLIL